MTYPTDAWGEPITKTSLRAWLTTTRAHLRDIEEAVDEGAWEGAWESADEAAMGLRYVAHDLLAVEDAGGLPRGTHTK